MPDKLQDILVYCSDINCIIEYLFIVDDLSIFASLLEVLSCILFLAGLARQTLMFLIIANCWYCNFLPVNFKVVTFLIRCVKFATSSRLSAAGHVPLNFRAPCRIIVADESRW